MTTILIKKKDTAGAPTAGDLTNAAGGTEIAVNTATKRIYTKDSGGNVVELGTNAGSSTIDALTVVTSETLSFGTASTALALDASKNIVSVTNTGTGNNVLATSPTLVTPALGTPSALVGTNITGTATNFNINGTVGATTATTGAFTTLSATGVTTVQAGTAALPAITTTGNTNTGIFFPAADTIAFSEGGVEAMRIDSAGIVGIGVTPSTWGTAFPALQVKNASFGGSTLADWAAVGANVNLSTNTFVTGSKYISDGYASYYRQYLGIHSWFTAPSGLAGGAITFAESMRIDSAGNVGIGTTSPTAQLNLNSETDTTVYNGAATDGQLTAGATQLIRAAAGANTNVAQLVFQARAAQPFNRIVSSGGTAPFMAFVTNNAERMRINSSGNVGIGTSSQTSMLQTAGSSSVSAFKTPNIAEVATISATAATGTINFDTTTQSVLYYTTNASGNFTVNFRGSSGTTQNTIMATGESLSATFLVTNGATAYYNSAVTVDGSSVTPKWQGGTAPTSGNASAIDSYTYVIIKTGSAAFTVLASVTKFA